MLAKLEFLVNTVLAVAAEMIRPLVIKAYLVLPHFWKDLGWRACSEGGLVAKKLPVIHPLINCSIVQNACYRLHDERMLAPLSRNRRSAVPVGPPSRMRVQNALTNGRSQTWLGPVALVGAEEEPWVLDVSGEDA